MQPKATTFLSANLVGLGQIMLQENSWTGLLFLVGIWYGSPLMGAAVTLSTLVGTGTAWLLKYDKQEIYSGLYGFNAALVGASLAFYFPPTPLVWVMMVAAAALSAGVMHWALRRGLPAYTFPFIALTWSCSYLLLHGAGLPYAEHPPIHEAYTDAMTVVSHGFGEVIFQSSVVAGLVFFVAIFLNSPLSALYGLAGALIGVSISHSFHQPPDAINYGLFSFNGVLCAIAFGSPRPRDGVFALLASVLAVLLNIFMVKLNLISLTFPFVLASWLTLVIKRLVLPKHHTQPTPVAPA